MSGQRRLRISAAGALLALAATFTTIPAGTPTAVAAPGSPGVPQPPETLFLEDFENGLAAGDVGILTGYTGAAPLSQTYTADPAWLTACNGWITGPAASATPPPGSGCSPGNWGDVKHLANVLGDFGGGPAGANHALTAYTAGNPGAPKVQLATLTPIPVPTANRFLAFSVDVAEVNCFANHAKVSFELMDGQTPIPVSATPIEPCADPQETIGGAAVGRYTSDGAVLFDGGEVGLRMLNLQPSGTGNDAAIDNVRLVDASPQLDVGFAPETVLTGASSTLTYTITNTDELGAKAGWSFANTLPAGLRVAGTGTTDCASGVVTASPGSAHIGVSGNLTAGQASCTASIRVTSAARGTYSDCPGAFSGLVGVKPPACAAVTFDTMRFDAHAHGGSVDSPLLTVAPLIPSDLHCAPDPGLDTGSLATASLGTLGDLGVITTRAEGVLHPSGLQTARAEASTAGVSLLGGLVTADEVKAVATATRDAEGAVTPAGSTLLSGLRVAGVPVVDAAVNADITIPLVGTVRVNERIVHPDGRGVTVNAVRVTLLTGVKIVIGSARASLTPPGTACPAE